MRSAIKSDQLAGNLGLAGLGKKRCVQRPVNHAASVLFTVEADAGVGHIIGDNQVKVLVFELSGSVVEQVLGLCSKADTERTIRTGCNGRQNIWITDHLQQQAVTV